MVTLSNNMLRECIKSCLLHHKELQKSDLPALTITDHHLGELAQIYGQNDLDFKIINRMRVKLKLEANNELKNFWQNRERNLMRFMYANTFV